MEATIFSFQKKKSSKSWKLTFFKTFEREGERKKKLLKEKYQIFFEVENEVFESKIKKKNIMLKVDELKLRMKHNENYLWVLLNERRAIV